MRLSQIALCLLISGTAFANVQGHVTMPIDSNHAQISVKQISVKEGDRVVLYDKVCKGPKVSLCHTEKVGTGVVSRVINGETSEIHVDGNTELKKGLIIEKE
jgi:hypothetical protein